ncbi:MAG: SDR family oxidoreductase [Nitrospirae bacterium]|nr:SDR family oxidoreductase [Nitrospirota bacterium]
MAGKTLPPLKIGNLTAEVPIIQGGMGVKVSMSGLASSVANEGGIGVIASVGLAYNREGKYDVDTGEQALRDEIRKARSLTSGIIGVNIMYAISDYERFVKAAIDEDVDLIISGAGMPVDLPRYLDGKDVKLLPIVSSVRAFKLICDFWNHNYNKIPDGVIVEGPKAGGHLGFSYKDIIENKAQSLEQIVTDIIKIADSYTPKIPVIAAGGVFDGADIAKYLNMGASGVQMASRFVCTNECDVHENFKKAWLDAKEEDLVIIKSPVGLPGRVIRNEFVERMIKGETIPFKCTYRCLKTCDTKTIPYCIAKALINAADKDILDKKASVVTLSVPFTKIAVETYGYMAPVKAALESSVVYLAQSFSQFSQVRFNVVSANVIKTSSAAGLPDYIKLSLYAESLTFRKKAIETKEIANVITFLLSQSSSAINGQSVVADAGMIVNVFDREVLEIFYKNKIGIS